MTTFTHHLSRVLGEMGIESFKDETKYLSWYGEGMPMLRLDDVLFLMPEIGEKMFWDKYTPQIRGQRFYKKQMKVGWVGHSHLLLDAFLEGGYPKAESYLLEILSKK